VAGRVATTIRLQCIGITTDPATPDLIAIGTSTGRVHITNAVCDCAHLCFE